MFVDIMSDNPHGLVYEIEDYTACGLENFHSNDGVPIGIKAILFNRYMHWVGCGSLDSFKQWYIQYYLNE